MADPRSPRATWNATPPGVWLLAALRGLCCAVGAVGWVLELWSHPWARSPALPFDNLYTVLAIVLTALPVLEWLGHFRSSDDRDRGLRHAVVAVTLFGAGVCWIAGTVGIGSLNDPQNYAAVIHGWWRLTVFVWILFSLLSLFRQVSLSGWNPAMILVLSFALVILLGAVLLMSPRCRREGEPVDFLTALFTSTSAVCVTGLNVVDAGSFWSRTGQSMILFLIQTGGLGIMTYGAFFSLLIGRGLMVRETALLSDLLEQKMLRQVRRLVLSILLTTLGCELIGAVLLSTLWPELPLGERLYYGLFHSVSAFCNAGFALMPDNFERFAGRWQVWGVLAGLIIAGGLSFVVLDNSIQIVWHRLRRGARHPDGRPRSVPPRLHLTSQLVFTTTLVLLIGGTLLFWWLERRAGLRERTWLEGVACAWFQSVTCRTAGFNTMPLAPLQEATKFLMVVLMFIGASPGSTGGGVKTTTTAVTFLTLRAVLRGRNRVEAGHRTIPDTVVYRALVVNLMASASVVVLTGLLLVIEDKPGQFLDCLFEVVSALATVGLSTGMTPSLSPGGQVTIIFAMFLGRVGPLTLLVALASRSDSSRYRYPDENVMLG